MLEIRRLPRLGDGSIQKWIRLVRPHTLNEARRAVALVVEDGVQGFLAANLNLGVFPARNLDDKVDNLLIVLVRVQGDVVPEGDGMAVFLEPYAPILMKRQYRSIADEEKNSKRRERTSVLRPPTVRRERAS